MKQPLEDSFSSLPFSFSFSFSFFFLFKKKKNAYIGWKSADLVPVTSFIVQLHKNIFFSPISISPIDYFSIQYKFIKISFTGYFTEFCKCDTCFLADVNYCSSLYLQLMNLTITLNLMKSSILVEDERRHYA